MTLPTELSPQDVRLMQGLAQEVFAIRPELVNGEANVGELAWNYGLGRGAGAGGWRTRLWRDGDKLVGWGWATLGRKKANLVWQVHPDRPELFDEILAWFAAEAGDLPRVLTPQAGDVETRRRLAAHGYVVDTEAAGDDGMWLQFNARSLADLDDMPVLPDGFRFRTAEDVSEAAVVQAHRDAWERSSYSAEKYDGVKITWPYRRDLHVLLEAPDGTFAASAIMWLDERNRAAEFEPVGTHPAFRRRGLGHALLLHGMHLARAAGADQMLVACAGSPKHPAAKALYYGLGFREFTRDLPYRRPETAQP